MAQREIRSVQGFMTLDAMLDEEGTGEEFPSIAIRDVLTWRIAQAERLSPRHAHSILLGHRREAVSKGEGHSRLERRGALHDRRAVIVLRDSRFAACSA